MYGRGNGRPFTEDRAADAHTRKGRIRAAMARDLTAAHHAGRVQVTLGRASDFFGPRAGAQPLIGDWVIPPALADRTAAVIGDPDMPHTYTFVPDIGENLVRLAERDNALGRVWHLPSPETRTTRDVVSLVYQTAGTAPGSRSRRRGRCLRSDFVNRTVCEINEMRYEFDEPFIVDATHAQPSWACAPRRSPTPSSRPCAGTARSRCRPPPPRAARSASRPGRCRTHGEHHRACRWRRRCIDAFGDGRRTMKGHRMAVVV